MQGIPLSSIRLRRRGESRRRYFRYRLRLRRRRLKIYLHPLFREQHPTLRRFVLLSQMRVGSSLLRSLLNSHREVFCHDEMFNHFRALNARLLLKNAAGARPETVFGYMLKPHQPEEEQRFDNGDWIRWMQDQGFLLIHLRREDELRQAMSIYMAMSRNVWIEREGASHRLEPVSVDIDRLLKIRAFIQSWKDEESSWVESLPVLKLSYERDLQDADRHQPTADAAFDFLGIERVPVQTNLNKTLPADPRRYALNWNEVMQAFA